MAKLSHKVFARLPNWIWRHILTNHCSLQSRMAMMTSYFGYWSTNVYCFSKRSSVSLVDNFLRQKTHYMSSTCITPDIKRICISHSTALHHASLSSARISMRNNVFCYPVLAYRYLRLYRYERLGTPVDTRCCITKGHKSMMRYR